MSQRHSLQNEEFPGSKSRADAIFSFETMAVVLYRCVGVGYGSRILVLVGLPWGFKACLVVLKQTRNFRG